MKTLALIGLSTLPSLTSAHLLSQLNPFKPAYCPDTANRFAGAAYFLSNIPEGNYVISSAIGHDGKVTLAQGVWAGGIGARGTNGPIAGTDALFSQGSITVSGKNLYTVNPGSNTVVMFEIDDNDPTKLQMVGQPADSGGEFPVSIAVSQKTGLVCALNGGAVNGVNCFKQNGAKGLIQVPNTQRFFHLNQTTPPSGPPGSVSQVIFSNDETQLMASVKSVPPQPGFIAIWDIDAKTGALSKDFVKLPQATGGALPFGITPLPGKNALLAADPSVGYSIFDLAPSSKNFKKNRSGTYPIKGETSTCWSTYSKKTGNTYIIDSGGHTVSEISVNENLQPTIVKQYMLANNSAPVDSQVATVGAKDFLYILAATRQSIYVLSLDGPGRARIIQDMPFQGAIVESGLMTNRSFLQSMATYIIS